MGNNYAIGALGYPGLGATDLQALYSVMNTPNPNSQVSFQGGTQTQTTTQPQVQYVQQPKEKNSKAPKVLLGLGVAALGAGFYFASKGKADLKGMAKVKDGAKTVLNNIKGKFGVTAATQATTTAKTAEKVATQGKRTVQEIGGKTIVTIPGETNVIAGTNARTKLINIGEKTDILKGKNLTNILAKDSKGTIDLGRLGKGYEISSFVTESTREIGKKGAGFKNGSAKTFKIFGVKGCEPQIYMDGKLVEKGLTEGISDELYESLVKEAKDIWNGKTPLTKLKQIKVRYTDPNTGLITYLKSSANGRVTDLKFHSAVTDKFAADSTKINSMRIKDKTLDQLLTAFKDKKYDNLNVIRANVEAAGHTFTIDGNGNILSVKEAGTGKIFDPNKNEELFNDWLYRNKTTVEKVPGLDKSRWFNRVFEA